MAALQTFDGSTVIRKGTTKPLYVTYTASDSDDTVTISAGGTFSLLDTDGAVVSGFPVGTTGYDSAAAASARSWYMLNTSGLTAGYYVGVFTDTVTGSDGLSRIYVTEMQVEVRSTTADFFTFDPTTDVGTVRMLIADIDPADFTFNDVEISRFIALQPSNLYAAAALACETWARGQGKVSYMYRATDGEMVTRRTTGELLELARTLRNAALSGSLQTGTISVSEPDDYLDSFRPLWEDFDGNAVVR